MKPFLTNTQMGTLECVRRYWNMLYIEAGINPKQDVDGDQLGLPHLLWMMDELVKGIWNEPERFDDGKVSRWLGFIQYGVIRHGYTTVQAERDFSRPLFTKGDS